MLAAVFAAAGAAKLADPEGSRRAASDFGVPQRLSRAVALGLPLAELATAAALLPATSAPWGALAALGLLLAFCVGIAANMAKGRAPDCHCFGQLHSEPAGVRTLLRNVALGACAAFAFGAGLVESGPSAVAWVARLTTAEALGAAALATALLLGGTGLAVALVTRRELRRHSGGAAVAAAEVTVPEHGLPVGTPAPRFMLPDVDGVDVTLEGLLALQRPVVLVFSDPSCNVCDGVMPNVARWQSEHAARMTLAVVSSGDVEAVREKAERFGLDLVLQDPDKKTFKAFEGVGMPSGVAISAAGAVLTPVAAGPVDIIALVGRIAEIDQRLPGLPVGARVPNLVLPDLDGNPVRLGEFVGEETMVLFWGPECPHCSEMLDELREWESNPPPGSPQLVVISSGTVDELRAEGFASTVLRDEQGAARVAFDAVGSPTGFLVDVHGRIAWPQAVGAPNVLRLLRSRVTAAVSA